MRKKQLFTDAETKELGQISRIEFEIQDTLHRVQLRFAVGAFITFCLGVVSGVFD